MMLTAPGGRDANPETVFCDRCSRRAGRPFDAFGFRLCGRCHELLRLGRITVREIRWAVREGEATGD